MKFVSFLVLFLTVTLAGCASTEVSSFADSQNRQIQLLALDCYNNNEGLRIASGGVGVWKACVVAAGKTVRKSPFAP